MSTPRIPKMPAPRLWIVRHVRTDADPLVSHVKADSWRDARSKAASMFGCEPCDVNAVEVARVSV